MEKKNQYKGLFYNQKTSHKFYEGGAHFSYYSLVMKLKEIKERQLMLTKREEKGKKERNEIIENKNVDKPILPKQKNKSMSYLLNVKQKIDNTKKINILLQKTKSNRNKIKLFQNPKQLENSYSVKRIKKINKNFSYNFNNNENKIYMPVISNQKNTNENIIINRCVNNNILLKNNSFLELLKNKQNNLNKISSTLGFNENNKKYNYYIINTNFKNKSSRNKNFNVYSSCSITQSLNKCNNNNNNTYTHLIDKIKIINNYNKNINYSNINKNIKLNNFHKKDFNINNNNHYIKLNKNKINNNTQIKLSKEKNINEKIIINNDKKKSLSIINFSSLLKNNHKYFLIKNK